MKARARKPNFSFFKTKLGFSTLIFTCSFFFAAGLFASNLLSRDARRFDSVVGSWSRSRQFQSVMRYGDEAIMASRDSLLPGESGDDDFTVIPFQVLSWKPRALYFPNFANAEQCERIINMGKPRLKPSTLHLRKGDTKESTEGIRTSTGVFISANEDKTGVLDAIEEKIAKATMLPRSHGEAFNILRYEIGQKYDSHYDAFDPAEYGPQESQRVATFLLYLSDVEEGGETMFPFENGIVDVNYDFQKCIGLKVKPRQGDGLLFYSMFPNITIDPASLHGSCPVIKGEKWVVTKWIRDQVQND